MKRPRQSTHGAGVTAPVEEFALGESPPPGKAEARRGVRGRSAPPQAPDLTARLLSGLRLIAGLVVVVVASSAVAYSLHRYALTTTRFGIKTVDLKGAKRLSPDQVRALAGIELGRNLFSFDTRVAEEKLLRDPWVSSAHVVRKLPATGSLASFQSARSMNRMR